MSAVETRALAPAAETRDAAAAGTLSRRFVYAAALAYAVIFAAAATASYLTYLEPRLDLGNMVQTIWSTAHGHFMRTTGPNGAEGSRLGAHFDPFLALLVPLWWIWANPILLLVAQAAAVASGALPVYWLARKHLTGQRLSVVFALAYLLYSPTQFNAFTPVGIHAVSFAVPLILYAIWFLDNDRLVLFGIFAVLAATTKEEIAAAVGGLGLWYGIRRGRPKIGGAIFCAGLAVSLLNVLVVIPHFAGGQDPFASRYTKVGGTPGGMLHVAATDPAAFVHQMVTWHKIGFLVLLLVPFLGLWALEPLMLVGAVPDLAINLLSSKPEQSTIFYQYTAGIIPFVVAASILGAARSRPRRFRGPALLAVVCCLAILSPIVWTIDRVHATPQAHVTATREALKLIPPGVPVSASQSLGAYVSTRRYVSVFPSLGRANWVIVGTVADSDNSRVFRNSLKRLRTSPRWRTVYNASGVTVLVRRAG